MLYLMIVIPPITEIFNTAFPFKSTARYLRQIMLGSAMLLSACAAKTAMNVCPDCKENILLTQTPLPIKILANTAFYERDTHALIHVYLEGDGRAWRAGKTPPSNPTTKQFIALKLMQLDTSPAIYLNRPCHGFRQLSEGCEYKYWADARYSEAVVSQMNRALDEQLAGLNRAKIVLIGHSGGGSLAMLLANRRTDVAAVITLAANIDHAAWTQFKGFTPLYNSLNSVDVVLPPEILRWHFGAELDTQVPAILIENAAAKDPYAKYELIPQIDHSCCWESVWLSILKKLNAVLTPPTIKQPVEHTKATTDR